MKNGRIQLRIDEDLKKQAEKAAEKRKLSLSFLVTRYLEDLVEQDQEAIRDDNGVRQI